VARPNILYIHSHDTGRWVEPYGHAISTPALSRLASEGVLFRQAFTCSPTCSPSRAALLTGTYPHINGQFGLVNRGFVLPDPTMHIVNVLKGHGYTSALAGIQHIAKDPAKIGYDDILKCASRESSDVASAAAHYLGSAPRQPFFLSVGFFDTHRTFPKRQYADSPGTRLGPANYPDLPEVRRDMAEFAASARRLDSGIGTVLQALEESQLAATTLVICTTDHGPAFPMMKCNLTDLGTGVMLIMRGPYGFSGDRVVDAMVSQLDIVPTVYEVAGVERPEWLRGVSLMPLIRGDSAEINEELYAEVNYHCSYEPQRSVRTKRWKYIRRFVDRETPFLANCDPGPAKEALMRLGWGQRPLAREQLYDLAFDPTEAHDLSADPNQKERLNELRGKLDRWMAETDDPILRGKIAAPPGVITSPDDDIEPHDIWSRVERPEGYA